MWGGWDGVEDTSLVRAGTGSLPLFLFFFFGKETRIWMCSLKSQQWGSKPQKFTSSIFQTCRISLPILGVVSNLWAMDWVCWKEQVKRPEAAVSSQPNLWLLLALMGLTPGDGEEPGATVKSSPSWQDMLPWFLGRAALHQLWCIGVTYQKRNCLKSDKQEKDFQKAWKRSRFMLRITPLLQYPELIMPNFLCTQKIPLWATHGGEISEREALKKR